MIFAGAVTTPESGSFNVGNSTVYATEFSVAAAEAGGVFRWARVKIRTQIGSCLFRFVLYTDTGGNPTGPLLDWVEMTVAATDTNTILTGLLPRGAPCVAGNYLFGVQRDDNAGVTLALTGAPNQGGGVQFPVRQQVIQADTAVTYGTAPQATFDSIGDLSNARVCWEIETTGTPPSGPPGVRKPGR